jgi:aminopeptidase N
MWTGDLVTCKWWDVTWLNEGMTHFFTFYISDLVIESQDNMYDLSIVLMDGALSYDIHTDAVSMVVPIRVPLDIDQAFDEDLIYNRGKSRFY